MTTAASPSTLSTDIFHGHDFDHQTSPASEVLRALTFARLRVVLFPGEAGLFPVAVDSLNNVLTQACVQIAGRLLVGTVLGSNVLEGEVRIRMGNESKCWGRGKQHT